MKKLKILYDYSRACEKEQTGIPFFVDQLYKHLKTIEGVTVVKTACIANIIPRKYWKLYRFVEKILYQKIYLPLQMKWGGYDVYIETNYMFIPLFKPKDIFVVNIVYDIALILFDDTQTKKHIENWRKKLPLSVANSDLILTISKSSKKDIESYLLNSLKIEKPVAFIYANAPTPPTPTLDYNKMVVQFNLPQKYFLFIGTLEPRKNPLRLIQAFHLFKRDTKSSIKLVFAGKKGWLYQDVLNYIHEHKLEDEVLFIGYVSEEEKVLLLQHCKAFLFLSIYEGFGIPPLEALRLNVPTLLSDIEVFHELFQKSALYANPYDIAEIALQMQNILLSPPTIDQKMLEQFNWVQSAYKLINIIKQYREKP